jgi:ubiquinone/menaquinone biosynthesis C-methylase UbiE
MFNASSAGSLNCAQTSLPNDDKEFCYYEHNVSLETLNPLMQLRAEDSGPIKAIKMPDSKSTVAARESEYFDKLVTSKGDFDPFKPHGWQTLARRFTEMAAPREPLSLLDIGCGTGQSRQIYIQHCRSYIGVDLSAEAIQIARSRFPDSAFIRADACKMPFGDASYDAVAFSSVLHHIDDYTQALVEARRLLKPGGRVFAFDPNLLHPAMALFRSPRSPLYIKEGVSPNERPLLPKALRRAFAAAGLNAIRQRCQSDIPYRAVAPRLINAFIGVYNVCDWVLEHSQLGRIFGVFTVTCGRRDG